MAHPHHSTGFHGPIMWLGAAAAGALLGTALTFVAPPPIDSNGLAVVPEWLVAPFALLLLSIAVMPLVRPRIWHDHFPDFAFFFGAIVVAYYLVSFRTPGHGTSMPHGAYVMLHAALEYFGFMALVGGLYIVSGGIVVRVNARGRPAVNATLLLIGAVLANIVGTTGASMLLIRPFMRINKGRLHPLHIVMFIFIVSNCGGVLTPIGDPPLYLGFLKGVPFAWTMQHMWGNWLLVNGALLVVFTVIDSRLPSKANRSHIHPGQPIVQVIGRTGLVCLGLMIVGVFIDPALSRFAGIHAGGGGWPVGATFQSCVALYALKQSPPSIYRANRFTFFPVKEVGILFLGIFAAMMPALEYLSAQGPKLGITTPTSFYFATGGLSALLDNAPTYLNFLQITMAPEPVTRDSIMALIATPVGIIKLDAISTGAVFFGAMTYIGNGPNFMVKSIAESAGVKMPGFFSYLLWACAILLPILVLNWLVLIR
ncbi:MAG: sodium:proton antiporter [Phycisphaerales bacterium]